jgi:hypothetical protein
MNTIVKYMKQGEWMPKVTMNVDVELNYVLYILYILYIHIIVYSDLRYVNFI